MDMRPCNYSVLCCLLFLLNSTIRADWAQTNGPPGGIVQSFFTSGSKFFMGGGVNYTGFLYVSTNDGASWREVNTVMTNAVPHIFTRDGAVLFAGTTKLAGGTFSGVFRSTDDGETWTAAGLPGISIYDLLVVPGSSGSIIYAGTDESAFRTTNNGLVWSPVNSGLPTIPPYKYVRTLAFTPNPAGGVFLFAGTDAGVFRSTNDGATWSPSNSGILSATAVRDFTVDTAGILYAATSTGPYVSADNGSNWTRINGDLPSFTQFYEIELKSDGMGGTVIFASNGGPGVWRSTNDGMNWNYVMAGPIHTGIAGLGVNQSTPNGGTLYAGSLIGFYRSTNNGLTWQRGNLSNSIVLDFAVIPYGSKGSRVFAGGYDDVYHSSNHGSEWTYTLLGGQINAMAVNFGSFVGPLVFVGTAGGGLFRSSDNGANWIFVSNDFLDQNVLSLLVTPHDGTFVVAGTFDGLYISTNNGNSWIESNNGLLDDLVLSLGAIPNGTGAPTLLAGTFSGVFRSTNNGASWELANSGLTNLEIRSITSSGQNAFVGTRGGGIFASADNGASWSPVNNGLSNTSVWDVVPIPGVTGGLLAGTDGGVFLSTNSGVTWSSISTGLPSFSIYAVTAAPDDVGQQYLLAGTAGRGVWKRPLSEVITSVPVASSTIPTEFTLEQNYPNPFNPSTVISFSLPESDVVTLKVFNILGEEIALLVSERLAAGNHRVEWRPQDVPSGVYLYRMEAGSFVQTRKLAFIK
jgi:photosystem II stability/assembly factor-like uncharacterized protein